MNPHILSNEIQLFIKKRADEYLDITKFILSGSPFEKATIQELVQQIIGLQKVKNKLPTWYHTSKIFYPPLLHIEQTSSEATASYKSKLVSGKLLIDITGGLGVDDYYFSKKVDQVIHCEYTPVLSAIAAYNFKMLQAENIESFLGNGLELVGRYSEIDWIYIDPSRRSETKGKVFLLKDCLPNIPENLDFLFQHCNQLLIKSSPMLDIHSGLKSLHSVQEIHIVAVENEVKELIWVLNKNTKEKVKIKAVNIKKRQIQRFEFFVADEKNIEANYAAPMSFLYEPNAAIMKSGGFHSISKKFRLAKLHTHSHLYTSDELIEFSGRRFIILKTILYTKKNIKKEYYQKANITIRNFPETVAELRKKFSIKEGGTVYLFFTIDQKGHKIVIECQKVKIS